MTIDPNNPAPVSWQALLGYLNFSEGRPDARFEKQVNDAYRLSVARNAEQPALALAEQMRTELAALKASGASAFKDTTQVEAVLQIGFERLLPAYREHHADLLAHLSDRELYAPFFIARALEAILAQGSPWDEADRVTKGAVNRLNDYLGWRPVAVLESDTGQSGRARGEIYDHERVRPIPLYIRGAGAAWGTYHDIVEPAVEMLGAIDADIRSDAGFDPEMLDELAVDPRAYDHGHPANRRTNYSFGEWDPHLMDNQGRYRRFILRQVTLDALQDRMKKAATPEQQADMQFEAAAVLAGVVLMGSGTTGGSATALDSSATLTTLAQRIARYRDAYYNRLLEKMKGPHGDRLRAEAKKLRQPFGGVRQHLNQYLARQRAEQQQERHLALLFAEMGHAEASRQCAERIPAPSVRMHSEVLVLCKLAGQEAERGQLPEAARMLVEAETLLQRGIHCGAFADPWNILGFQGLFPLSPAREDSIHDHRVEQLIDMVDRLLDTSGRLMAEAAARDKPDILESVKKRMKKLAEWWDPFATTTVADVRHINGAEALEAAEHVAVALGRWRQHRAKEGGVDAGLVFWKQFLHEFRSPRAFARVVEALLERHDLRAALALLMNWLGQHGEVPLESGRHSFHLLILQWLRLSLKQSTAEQKPQPVERKFFDYLESNAEELWDVPQLATDRPEGADQDEDEENPYGAAYEGMTFKDSAADGGEGSVIDEGEAERNFDLEAQAEQLEPRLRFLFTVGRLWETAALHAGRGKGESELPLAAALSRACANCKELLQLIQDIGSFKVPRPTGSQESLVEFDRRQNVQEHLLETAIAAYLRTSAAARALLAATGAKAELPSPSASGWEPLAAELEQAVYRGDAARSRAVLPAFQERFREEPLLVVPLSAGGEASDILRARAALATVHWLEERLPRLGLLWPAHQLLSAAREMEARPMKGRKITEFDSLFQAGFQAALETVVRSSATWAPEEGGDRPLVELLERTARSFLNLWVEHSKGLQLSTLEKLSGPDDWKKLKEFIQRYGGDLFKPRFMTLGNLRGILHQGVKEYLEHLREEADPLHPIRLIDELDERLPAEQAVRWLKRILRILTENYDIFKDYNTTTTQSDYGEQLHVLLDFLRLKASYLRQAWQLRPLLQVHAALARNGREQAAVLWEGAFERFTRTLAENHLKDLAKLEQEHGIRLRTVRDLLEERFVKPLAVERLCALIGPALKEMNTGAAGPAMARFEKLLREQAAEPTGVGLDVPIWIQRLYQELHRARPGQATIEPEESDEPPPKDDDDEIKPAKLLTFAEVQQELAQWGEIKG